MRALCWSVLLAASCGGPPQSIGDGALPDAPIPDAAPPDSRPDAALALRGNAILLDDIHIAGLTEDPHAFSLLGQVVNPQLGMAIDSGQLLVALELIDVEDPSGQAGDDALDVGILTLMDVDGDPTDDFDPEHPEAFQLAPGSIGPDGTPTILLTDSTIAPGGALHAEGLGSFGLGGLPLPLQNPEIDGDLVPTQDGSAVLRLERGRLVGAVPASTLAFIPNPTAGMCQGNSLLDVIATGCGLIQVQPDVDLDGDGLERFYDTMGDADAGTATDGRIDRCVDGDGTEILGVDCVSDPRIQDGYRLIFVIHGVRAWLLAP